MFIHFQLSRGAILPTSLELILLQLVSNTHVSPCDHDHAESPSHEKIIHMTMGVSLIFALGSSRLTLSNGR